MEHNTNPYSEITPEIIRLAISARRMISGVISE